jgi:hypothetical protein
MQQGNRVRSVRSAVLLIAIVAASGCGTVSNPAHEPAVLTTLQVSDAITGKMGLVRIEFSNPVAADTTVTLTSSHPAVATIPASVTVLAGGLSADVQYMGVASGTAQITATTGMDSQVAAIRVVDTLIVYPYGVQNMEAGALTQTGANVNIRVADPLDVTFSSSNPSIATVDAMVTIPAFSSSNTAQVTGVSPGTAMLMTSVAGSVSTTPITVVDKAHLNYLYVGNTMMPGTSQYVYAYLDAVPRTGASVALASTNPAIAMVPPMASTSGNSSVPFSITAGSMSGTSTITASFNGFSLSAIAYVGSPSNSNFLRFNSMFANNSVIEVGAATLVFADFGPTSQSNDSGTIMFTSGGVLSTPSMTMTIPANTSQVSFPVTGLATGTTNIVVIVDGQQQTCSVTVKNPVFSLTPAGTVLHNETTTIGINSDTLLAFDRTWALSSSNTGVAQVSSASVTSGAGSFGTQFGLKAIAPGTSTITATSGSTTLTTTITVD